MIFSLGFIAAAAALSLSLSAKINLEEKERKKFVSQPRSKL
jgi:hypothetical protein